MARLLEGPMADGFVLSDAEIAWFKRGRNASRTRVAETGDRRPETGDWRVPRTARVP